MKFRPPYLCLGFLYHCHCKTNPIARGYHYTVLHPVLHPITLLHPVSSRASQTSGLLFQFIHHSWLISHRAQISDSILATNVTLDRSKAYICFVYWSRHIYFTSWLDSIDEYLDARRQKSQVLRPCFDLVNYSLSSVGELLVSSSLVWNTANRVFDWSNR